MTELPSGAAEYTVATRNRGTMLRSPWGGLPKQPCGCLPGTVTQATPLGAETKAASCGFLPLSQLWSLTPPRTSRILLPLERSSHTQRFSFNKYLSAYYVLGINLDAKDVNFFSKVTFYKNSKFSSFHILGPCPLLTQEHRHFFQPPLSAGQGIPSPHWSSALDTLQVSKSDLRGGVYADHNTQGVVSLAKTQKGLLTSLPGHFSPLMQLNVTLPCGAVT